MKKPPKRPLSEEEKKLWRYVTRHDKKLHPDMNVGPADAALPESPEEGKPTAFIPIPSVLPHRKSHKTYDAAPLPIGSYANIDRNTAERFRKGRLPIDGQLDLHGLHRGEAYVALENFINYHAEYGSRCLLVITGKGARKNILTGLGRGILRELLPVWLAGPELRRLVLAFDVAQPRHGGSGAFYVLLRRQR